MFLTAATRKNNSHLAIDTSGYVTQSPRMTTSFKKLNNAEIAVIAKRIKFEIGCATEPCLKESLVARLVPVMKEVDRRRIALNEY